MNKATVVCELYNWFRTNPRYKDFKVELELSKCDYRADIGISDEAELEIVVECKGTHGDLYEALGQCMYYFYYEKEECEIYLAIPKKYTGVPENYEGKPWEGFKEVNDILEMNDSPIGLLIVSPDEKPKVKIVRKAKTRA